MAATTPVPYSAASARARSVLPTPEGPRQEALQVLDHGPVADEVVKPWGWTGHAPTSSPVTVRRLDGRSLDLQAAGPAGNVQHLRGAAKKVREVLRNVAPGRTRRRPWTGRLSSEGPGFLKQRGRQRLCAAAAHRPSPSSPPYPLPRASALA